MNTTPIQRRSIIALGVAAAAGRAAWAQDSRPLSFIVPQPAGNPTDAIARKLQPVLQRELGQTVIVENLPGAGGSIGVSKALSVGANAPVLLIASQTEPILTPLSIAAARYKPEDLRCVGMSGFGPYVLAGRADLPATNLAELIALAKQRSTNPLSYAHIGTGSMIHLLGEQFGRKVDAKFNFIPYKGVPPVIQDLLGGQIDLTFLPLAGATVNLVEGNKVRIYGNSWRTPSTRLPSIPLLSKLDPVLKDFVYTSWAAVFVPRTLPEAMTQRLHAAIKTGLESGEVRAFADSIALERVPPMSLAELEGFYQGEIRQYQAMAKAIGVTPQ